MKTGCLIQDLRRVDLKNLTATREGGSLITADVVDKRVSPSLGDASLVIEGQEFPGNVVRFRAPQVAFESASFDEIARKLA